jgi:hypothetical protein
MVSAATQRPEGAFGVRQLAAAFKNGPICPFFEDSLESGSKLCPLHASMKMNRAIEALKARCSKGRKPWVMRSKKRSPERTKQLAPPKLQG